MSDLIEPDMQYWSMYLKECEATGTTPRLSDYSVFLQEMDLDRREQYESEQTDVS